MSTVEAHRRVNFADPVPPGAPLPPGPAWLPPWAGFALWFAVQPWWGPWVRRRYGDVANVPNMFSGNLVQISDPALIQELHAGPPQVFHAGEGNRILRTLMGEHSILTTDEEEHKRLRKLSMSGFTAPALRGYCEMTTYLRLWRQSRGRRASRTGFFHGCER